MKLTPADITFILTQLTLPGNDPRNAPLGTILDPFGIRDVLGIGNNVNNPKFGAADQLFPRLTTASFRDAEGTFTFGAHGLNIVSTPTSNSVRDVNLVDSSPRTISNLVANQSAAALTAIGYDTAAKQRLAVLDEPTSTPGGRLSPLTGATNPLPYSSLMTLFGQFFDHGLDFVHKGADGAILVPLLPSDALYNHPDNAIYAPDGVTVVGYNNFIIASRTDTVHVDISKASTDTLVSALGLAEDRYTAGEPGVANGTVTGNSAIGPDIAEGGVFILNSTVITIARGATAADVVAAINAQAVTTGVSAAINGSNHLVLTYAQGESRNTVSPFIDLSQSYGSSASHTAFVRDYDKVGSSFVITGRLVSGIDTNGDGLGDGMATWKDIKDNAAIVGVTLHDKDVTDIPQVRLAADGSPFLDSSGMWLVARHQVTGQVYYVQDSLIGANTVAVRLNADGTTTLISDAAAIAALTPTLLLQAVGHAFLDDMAHGVLGSLSPVTGDLTNPDAIALLNRHYIAGDGRVNENIGLTAIHDVFHAEHNRILLDIHALVLGGVDTDGVTHAARADAASWTGEMFFQAAKLVTEMEYQHMVFGEFSRKLSPNISAFAAYNITIDPAISAEFAHAVYRFGHSMLTETVGMTAFDPLTGLANGEDKSMGLIEAFLNPTAFGANTAGEIAIGMSSQVGNAIDEWVTDALRNNLVGLPLDLATLNIVRGRDTGIGSLNEVRGQLWAQTGLSSLKPYASWDDFGLNLLHPEALENFIMAYARDAVLSEFGDRFLDTSTRDSLSLTQWTDLQNSGSSTERDAYAASLRAAAQAAMSDTTFMSGSIGLNNIDLWLGGLAEAKVPGGMLGATFDFIFATQMIQLQNADRLYYLSRLAGTDLLVQIEGQLFSDIIQRNTGVKHLYSDVFTVPDGSSEIGTPGSAGQVFGTLVALKNAHTTVVDAEGITRSVGTGGWVGSQNAGWTYYGNPGEYLDARGLFSPNNTTALKGNASEVIGGTDNAERINALGGNDAVWGDGGDDTIEGGDGSDFLHGGTGNDLITDSQGDDLIWGDAGNDTINAGSGIDQVFGGDGNDQVAGGLGADVVNGDDGNDAIYGDSGAVIQQLVNGVMVEVMDRDGDADVINGGLGNDTIFGGGGDDIIDAGEGDDAIYGGLGNDASIGWFGNDTFYMDASDIGFGNSMDGGMDYDVVDYSASAGVGIGTGAGRQGVTIDLNPVIPILVPIGAPPLPDFFFSIEGVIGSNYNDSIRGGASVPLNFGLITDQLGGPVNFGTAAFPLFRTTTVTIDGGLGNDTIEGGDGTGLWNLQADGTYAYEGWALNADAITYTYVGGTWDPTTAGPGMDLLIGGAGTDTVSYLSTASTASGPLGAAGPTPNVTGVTVDLNLVDAQFTVNAGWDMLSGFENVIGSAFDDILTGDGNANRLDGDAGNDILNGGAGDDTLVGGAGDDVLAGGTGVNTVNYSGTNSTATTNLAGAVLTPGLNGVSVTLSVTVAQDTFNAGLDTLSGIQNAVGSIFNDTLSGGADAVLTANLLDGGAGDDSLLGGGGNDTLIGGLGNDTLTGGAGIDTVSYAGTTGAVAVNLSAAAITAGALGSVAASRSAGAAGIDVLTTVENVIGGDGNDTIVGSTAANQLDAGLGDDSLNGGDGNDTLLGGAGNDTLIGGLGTDSLSGGVGNDTLSDGSTGNNTLAGGDGNDLYLVAAATDLVSELLNEGNDTVQTAFGTAYTLTANVENLTYTGSTAFTGTGNALNNTLTAGAGAQSLVGGDGDDTLIGGDGNDTLTGGVGIDTASYATATLAVTVNLSTPTGTATGGAGSDTLTLIENVTGGAGDDSITGSAANNVLDGGAGNDTLAGGAGNDTYVVDAVGDVLVEASAAGTDTVRTSLAAYTLVAGNNVENLLYAGTASFTGTGNELNNALTGGAGNDTLVGEAGDDTLDGGQGNDSMSGGAGDDVYLVDSASDKVKELFGSGNDTVRTSLSSFTLGDDVENLTYTGPIGFYGVGNSLENILTGSGGDDTLTGGMGADTLYGGAGSDTASYASAAGPVVVDLKNGLASGSQGNDTLSLIENVIGGAGKDTLTGDDADNRLDGGGGSDTLIGGLGNDTYVVDEQTESVIEVVGQGNDTVLTSLNQYTLGSSSIENLAFFGTFAHVGTGNEMANLITGGVSNDKLYGEYGDDTLDGGQGNDTLYGGMGNDTLKDGIGFNVLAGGEGDDIYIVSDPRLDQVEELAGDGIDTIKTALLNYTLEANVENLSYTGTAALVGFSGIGNELDNVITGGLAGDNLQGGAGNDTLIGGLGNDALDGGAGSDTASYSTATAAVTVNLLNRVSSGSAGTDRLTSIENVIGSAFNDTLTGDAGANVMEGGGGNDTIDGGAGTDTASYASAGAAVSVTLATQGTNNGSNQNTQGAGTDRLNNFENLQGSAFNDTLTGSTGNNVLEGGFGNDSLSGGSGNDTLLGGVGIDTLNGGAGDDSLDGGFGADTVTYAGLAAVTVNLRTGLATGGGGNDTLVGVENVIGTSNDDTLVSGDGANRLDGGTGTDTVSYDGTTTAVAVNLTTQLASGGAGNDVLVSIENAIGGSGADSLTGSSAANLLSGGDGNDTLVGLGGDDVLLGGAGDDSLLGGDGIDTASYAAATAAVSVSLAASGGNTVSAGSDSFSSIENLVGSAYSDTLTGDALANVLDGGALNDTLVGGAGNDTLVGGAGDDSLVGGDGLDTASYASAAAAVTASLAASGASTVNAGSDSFSGIENLLGSAFNDTLTGDAAANALDGGAGNDTLTGGDGDDTLIGGAGNDSLVGGVGTDTVSYASASSAVAVNLTTGAVTGGAGTDTLATIENVIGSAYNDTLTGAAAVVNTLAGGAGNDSYVVDTAGDVVVELANEGTDLISTALASWTLADNVENLTYTSTAAFTGTGNALDNLITGAGGNDTLSGAAGNDTLVGGLGNDSLDGGAGVDTASYSTATAAVTASLATGLATGGGGSDTLVSIENLIGGAGADTLTGSAGDNYIDGGAGIDSMTGGLGNDTYVVSVATDVVVEGVGAGTDTVITGLGTYTLAANVENLVSTTALTFQNVLGRVFTGTGNDLANKISGTLAQDSITGGLGDDTLVGGGTSLAVAQLNFGADTLDGGAGNDLVSFALDVNAVTVDLSNQTTNQSTGSSYLRLISIENLVGSAFNDSLTGNASANVLDGAAGDDTIFGGAGNDTLTGGAGTDTLTYAGTATAVTVSLRTGTAAGTDAGTDTLNSFENVIGTGFNDSLEGDAGINVLDGGAGNDTLIGSAGNDTLTGGTGTDVAIFAGVQGDYTFVQDAATGNIVVRGSAGNTMLIGVENIQFGVATAGAVAALPLTDIAAPTVASFSSSTANGVYGQGSQLALVATLSESVRAGSALTVTLDSGATVVLTAATAGTTLTGTYVVGVDQASDDLTVASYELTGGSLPGVLDVVGNAMTSTSLPVSNIADTSALVIDGVGAAVLAFKTSATPGTYGSSATLIISATLSEMVQAGTSISALLNTGETVTFSTPVAATVLRGAYTIGASPVNVPTLGVVGYTVNAGGGDFAGNPVAPAADSGYALDRLVGIDTQTPGTPHIDGVTDDVSPVTGQVMIATNDRKPVLTITADPGSTVDVYNDTRYLGRAVESATPGQFTFTPSYSLGEGSYKFNAKSVDAAGNVSDVSNFVDIKVDFTAPLVPTVTEQQTSSLDPTVTGTASLQVGETLAVKFGTETYSVTVVSRPTDAAPNGVVTLAGPDGPLVSSPLSVDLTANTWSLERTGLSDGSYSVQATVTDLAGNTRTDTTTSELTVNQKSPTVLAFYSTDPDGYYAAGQPINVTATMSEVVQGGGTITVLLNTGETVDLTTPYPTQDSLLLVGTYTVASGNSSDLRVLSYSAVLSTVPVSIAGVKMSLDAQSWAVPVDDIANLSAIVVDTTGPAKPVITNVVDNASDANQLPATALSIIASGYTNDATPTFTITAETGAIVRVYGGTPGGGTFLGTASEQGSTGTYTLVKLLIDGTYTFYATAQDKAGNLSQTSAAYSTGSTTSIIIDTVAPVTAPTVNPLLTNDTSPLISGTVTLATSEVLTVTVDGVTYSASTTPAVGVSGSTWSLQLPVLADNTTYSVTATVTDGAGNVTSDAASGELVIESVPPTIASFGSSTADGAYKAGAAVVIIATTNEAVKAGSAVTVTLNTGDTVTLVAASNGTTLVGTYTVGAGDTAADLDVTSYILGTSTAVPTDLAGNAMVSTTLPSGQNTLAASKALVIDTTNPLKPAITGVADNVELLTGAVANFGQTNDSTPTFTVSAEANATVTLFYIKDAGVETLLGTATQTGVGTGLYTYTPESPLPEGNYGFTARATDEAGNVSAASDAFAFILDTTPPATVVTVNVLYTTVLAPQITGTVTLPDTETLSVVVNGVTYTVDSATPVVIDKGASTWSLQLPTLAVNTTYSVTATVADAAGNVTNDATSSELVIDQIAPTVTGFSATSNDGTYRSGDPVNLTATVSEAVKSGSTIKVTLDTGDQVDLVAAADGTTLSGVYTVGQFDISRDLNVTGYLLGSGATVPTDLAGNVMASTTLPIGANSLAGNKALVVNGNVNVAFASTSTAVAITEGGTGTTSALTPTPMVFTVNLDKAAVGGEVLGWSVVSSGVNAATASDFSGATTGTVTFAAGETSSTITLNVNGDTQIEATETFQLVLAATPSTGLLVTDSAATGTITTNEAALSLNNNNNNQTVAAAQPWVLGNNGNDSLNASARTASVVLDGGTGNDTLTGGSGSDQLLGGSGADSLVGGAGNDFLSGGVGADRLTGGTGSDSFVFAAGDSGQNNNTTTGFDVISDFAKGARGTGDLIDFSAVLSVGGSATAADATHASINVSTGVATFAANSGTNLADALADVAGSLTAAADSVGEFAFFRVNNGGAYYLFVSDGVAGVGANDVVVQLTGITTVTAIDLSYGNLSITA